MLARLLSPPFLLALAAALLHGRGVRQQLRVTSAARLGALRWRALALYAGLATLVAALDSPIDDAVEKLFWVHMTQHVLLMMVAAPLIVLGAPWLPMWRGLPRGARRRLAVWWLTSPGWRAARGATRWALRPLPAWILLNVALCAWHVPALYDLALHDQAVHELEHLSLLMLGVLFWLQVVDSPPLRAHLSLASGVLYVLTAATVAWLLALVLAFATAPLYPAYASLPSRPGGLSALADQQLAAGVMWGPGSVPFGIFVFVALYRWLAPPAARGGAGSKPSGEAPARAA